MAESPRRDLDALLDAVRRQHDGRPPSTDAHWTGRARVVEAALARPARRRATRTMLAAVAALLLAVASVVGWQLWRASHRAPLAPEGVEHVGLGWTVDGAPTPAARSTLRTADTGVTVTFAEDSRVELDAETSVVVDTSTVGDARLVLERGRLGCDIVHRDGATWRVEAGPWTVHVVGTRFDVDWQPSTGEFGVALHEGRVEITGPDATRPVVLEAGTRLRVDERDEPVRVVALDPVLPPSPVEVPAPLAPPAEVTPIEPMEPPPTEPPSVAVARSERTPRAPAPPEPTSWRADFEAGDFEAVVQAASVQGRDEVLATRSRDELLMLAESARYVGELDLARGALGALRERFSGHADAAEAAFLLGRIAERERDPEAAARWFATALDEAGAGASFVPEALGRRMLSLDRAGADDEARAVAEAYLASYPAGAWASTARRILAR